MRKSCLFIVSVIILTLFSCNSNDQSVRFEGNLSHCPYSKIYLYKVSPEGDFLIDSSEIKNGMFTLKDKVNKDDISIRYPGFYKIFFSETNHLLTIANKGEKLHFIAQADSLVKTYSVTGGKDALLMYQLDRHLKQFIDSVETLYQTYEQNQYNDSLKSVIELKYNQLVSNHQIYLFNFIQKNKGSLSTLSAFYQSFNRRIFIPEEENIALLQNILSEIKKRYPMNENIPFIEKRIEMYSK